MFRIGDQVRLKVGVDPVHGWPGAIERTRVGIVTFCAISGLGGDLHIHIGVNLNDRYKNWQVHPEELELALAGEYFIVCCPDVEAYTKFPTFLDAQKAAERMAATYPDRKYWVLQAVGSYTITNT